MQIKNEGVSQNIKTNRKSGTDKAAKNQGSKSASGSDSLSLGSVVKTAALGLLAAPLAGAARPVAGLAQPNEVSVNGRHLLQTADDCMCSLSIGSQGSTYATLPSPAVATTGYVSMAPHNAANPNIVTINAYGVNATIDGFQTYDVIQLTAEDSGSHLPGTTQDGTQTVTLFTTGTNPTPDNSVTLYFPNAPQLDWGTVIQQIDHLDGNWEHSPAPFCTTQAFTAHVPYSQNGKYTCVTPPSPPPPPVFTPAPTATPSPTPVFTPSPTAIFTPSPTVSAPPPPAPVFTPSPAPTNTPTPTSTPGPSNNGGNNKKSGGGMGMAIGGVAGGIAVLAAAGASVWGYKRHQTKKKAAQQEQQAQPTETAPTPAQNVTVPQTTRTQTSTASEPDFASTLGDDNV